MLTAQGDIPGARRLKRPFLVQWYSKIIKHWKLMQLIAYTEIIEESIYMPSNRFQTEGKLFFEHFISSSHDFTHILIYTATSITACASG